MGHEAMLGWSLVPAAFLFLTSLASAGLTAHYWIIGDFGMQRWIDIAEVKVKSGRPRLDWKVIITEYVNQPTDAAVVASSLGVGAGIVYLLAWYKLRRANMDEDYNMPRRRFWVCFAFLGLTATFGAALSTVILHYTKKGSGEFGCDSNGVNAGGDKIYYCTREMGACNFIPELKRIWADYYINAWPDGDKSEKICAEIQAVKWIQCLVMLACVVVMAFLAAHSITRRKTRYQRMMNSKGKEAVRDLPPWS